MYALATNDSITTLATSSSDSSISSSQDPFSSSLRGVEHAEAISSISNLFDLTALKSAISTLPTAQETKIFKLNDTNIFELSIGKRVLDSELVENGAIPIYSANVKQEFGFFNKELLTNYDKPCVLWGIDGDWMTSFIPKGKKFYPTDHCGVLLVKTNDINTKILEFSLFEAGKEQGFSRNFRASIQRVKNLKIPLPPIEVQNKIISVIEIIESKIALAKESQKALENANKKILEKYLN